MSRRRRAEADAGGRARTRQADPAVNSLVREILARHQHREAPLIEVLHGVQEALGHLPEDAILAVAQALNLSRAEVHGVVSFYPDFQQTPPARHRLQICRAEACQAVGARELEASAQAHLGVGCGQQDAAGRVSFEAAYCLGNCALGPSVRVDGRLLGKVTPQRLAQWLREATA